MLFSKLREKTCRTFVNARPRAHARTHARTFYYTLSFQVDWCGDHDTEEGHKQLSAALNATGRPMVLELCRGTYQDLPKWGYAPEIAQVWRATGDHHDEFSSTLDQVAAIALRHSSGPYGWAYGGACRACRACVPCVPCACVRTFRVVRSVVRSIDQSMDRSGVLPV